MIGIIVVFPKKENAINIRNLLVQKWSKCYRSGDNGGTAMALCGYCGEGLSDVWLQIKKI